jgi:opacity protein-like surface antigen
MRGATLTALLLAAVAIVPNASHAQWSTDPPPPPAQDPPPPPNRFEITPIAGYQFGGGFSGEEGEINMPADFMYGVALDVWVRPEAQAEFLYTRQETRLEFDPAGVAPAIDLGDLTIHEFQLGGNTDLRAGRIRPYALGTLGVTWFDPANDDIDGESRFSSTLGAGIRAPVNGHIGLRVEGRWIINFFNSSGSVFCGSGGCLVNFSGDFVSQGALSGGLSIGF